MSLEESADFHARCFACGQENVLGLQLKFDHDSEGTGCTVHIPSFLQSYDGVVHGGIIATMLDAAMVHTLRYWKGGLPVTCRLEVRYLQAVKPERPLLIRARIVNKRRTITMAEAELLSGGECLARARGAFTIQQALK